MHTWTGLATPESVLVDGDRIFVSNINGKPLDVDNNGFIAELAADGTVKTPKLIEGGKKYKLNAPKGMAVHGGLLYVADIDHVRTFDLKTAAHKADIAIKGATFLNDVVAGPDGKIYVSDSGMKAGKDDFEPTGTDAIWVIEKGKAKPLVASKDLTRPNGLAFHDAELVVAPFGGDEVYAVADGKRGAGTKAPKGGLDGLVILPGGWAVTSSWQGEALYQGQLGKKLEPLLEKVKAPADIAFDAKNKWLLVPRFLEDKVEAYEYDPETHKLVTPKK